MKLLILGGGVFLGAAVLDATLARGHAPSVFNRGRARTEWPPGVEVLRGERQSDLARLSPRRWDAVIDTCGYTPADMRPAAQHLRGCGQYLFVSSVSAYAAFEASGQDESAALARFDAIAPDERDMAHYGAQKAACEAVLREAWGEQALIVRPGLIVGPGDPSGRFSYWPWRAAVPGPMLVPDAAAQPLQFIDVRDLAAWMIELLEARAVGPFNATGPIGAGCSWPVLAQACVQAAARHGHAPAQACFVDESVLLAQGLTPWTELPLWIPASDAGNHGFMRISTQRAQQHGLRTRPLSQTLDAVLAGGIPALDDPRRQGKLTREREADVLAVHSRGGCA
jgi:2'-hydroxyisoflavone reductase